MNNIEENNEKNNGESFLAGYIDRKTRRQRRREDHIILQITIEIDGVAIETVAMIDSGATTNFIDKRFCQENQLPMQQKLQAQPVYLIDGSDMESGPITHQTNIRIHAANHTEEITFEETTLGGFPIILGLPWLKKHNPEIGWKTHEIRFNSEYCQNNCMNVGTTVEDITDEEAFIQKQLRPEDISLISATAFKRAARLGIAGSVSIREIDEEL